MDLKLTLGSEKIIADFRSQRTQTDFRVLFVQAKIRLRSQVMSSVINHLSLFL